MQKEKTISQKIKDRTSGRFSKVWGFVGGLTSGLCAWGVFFTIAVFVTVSSILPAAALAIGTVALGALSKVVLKKRSYKDFSAVLTGALIGIGVPFVLLGRAGYQKNHAENIFKSDRQAVTQTFNHVAPSIKDGFTYKGVTYKVSPPDMTKKAA